MSSDLTLIFQKCLLIFVFVVNNAYVNDFSVFVLMNPDFDYFFFFVICFVCC